MTPPQSRYSALDRELLAVYESTKHFRHMIESVRTIVYTDHLPLTTFYRKPSDTMSPRQQRHLAFISEFIDEIRYIKGQTNVVADTLSRNVASISIDAVDLPSIAEAQSSDLELSTLLSEDSSQLQPYNIGNLKLYCHSSGPTPRPFVPASLRQELFNAYHNLSHPGIRPSQRMILSHFFWPEAKMEIAGWCRQCLRCQRSKVQTHVKPPPGPMPVVSSRFEIVHLDIVGPLPLAAGRFRYLLTMIDRFTNWPAAVPLQDITTPTVADAFISGWISMFGVPQHIITDRGTQFESQLLRQVAHRLGFQRLRTTAYHPQCNGKIERMHRRLKTSFRARGDEWYSALPLVLWSFRSLPVKEEKYSPFTLLTGELMNLPGAALDRSPTADPEDLVDRLRRLTQHHQLSNPPPTPSTPVTPAVLQSSNEVWLRTDRIRAPLEAPYTGPYKVLRKGPRTFVIDTPTGPQTVSVQRLKPAITTNPDIPTTTTTTRSGRKVQLRFHPSTLK